jgi:hypothetical protein
MLVCVRSQGCNVSRCYECDNTIVAIAGDTFAGSSYHTFDILSDLLTWNEMKSCKFFMLLQLELEFILLPTDSLPVRLGIGPPFGTLDHILSCSSFFV